MCLEEIRQGGDLSSPVAFGDRSRMDEDYPGVCALLPGPDRVKENEIPDVAGDEGTVLRAREGEHLSVGRLIPVGTEFEHRENIMSSFP